MGIFLEFYLFLFLSLIFPSTSMVFMKKKVSNHFLIFLICCLFLVYITYYLN